MRGRVLNLLLTHQSAGEINSLLDWWRGVLGDASSILLVVNHLPEQANDFERIKHPQKILVQNPRLRTRDHQRERQSYVAVFAAAAQWLAGRTEFSHVHFVEYDHLPLRADLGELQQAALEAEGADVLGFSVRRVDRTSHAIWLSHAAEEEIAKYFASLSVREDSSVVLSMFGTGSFWTRRAFEAVATVAEPCPIYLELWVPTLAHHLGYRVRNQPDTANRYVANLGDRVAEVAEARAAGGWTIHPVKTLDGLLDAGAAPAGG